MSSKSVSPSIDGEKCIDCGAPVTERIGGIAICENCLSTRGSCCPEFGAFDLTEDAAPREYASSPCSAHLFEEADTVRHDRTAQRFETSSGARLDYRATADNTIDITHTCVPEHLRGKGLAAQLMDAAIDHAKEGNLSLEASCDYAQAYLKRKGLH
ncbi:MAG TPA: hypothetical protein DEA90_15965 [Opitutae bacterium]|nr:hypothetical protein [Puniceicoccaceae bacterium]HBR95655.1 hypothetical protein [Opitutae bacterium]|tara:strand:- start:15465 stop:15932 length:468 start_codon:yes stop_codon:yes gene_type:complete